MLDNIFIRVGTELYRQVLGIPMSTNCATLVAALFLFCYEKDFMMSLSDDKQADTIQDFNTTSGYLDDTLNINNIYFDNLVILCFPLYLHAGGLDLRLYDGSDLKTYLQMRWPDPSGFNCWISFAQVFRCMYC